jgi:CDP-4-dehydro-6-deoxyglucose reductase
MSSQAFVTRMTRRKIVADGVVDLTFSLVEPARLDFRAGQFVTLSVGKNPEGREIRRSYSIASQGNRGEALRFLIKVIPGGPGSDFFLELPLGHELSMTGPHGFFQLAPEHPGDVVFAATGTGLAPVMSMLLDLAGRDEPGARHLYWGLRQESDLFVPDEIAGLCDAARTTLHTYLSRPTGPWTGTTGRITQAVLEALPSLRSPTFYIVGNGAMIVELKQGLVDRGVDRKKQIRTESFFD